MAAAAVATAAGGGIVPAQLGFLAIFNPSLGDTDETIDDQIVYYASLSTQSSRKRRRARARPTEGLSQEERHERLRQIGLAQGMVNFSRGFSEGAPVDAIETEKSRVIAHELEPGWWILASVDLNKVPLPPRLPIKGGEKQEEKYEYTSREMKPATLLLRDLLRAHSIFLLHHDSSLSALFVRYRRSKFVAILTRYWDLFLSTWNVMLHGNPARDIFGGINIAASGELGVGVGEEERGSGEREVLEGLVGRVEGLVDLVVSRFGEGEDAPDLKRKTATHPPAPWLGSGQEPGSEDGAIFLGTGALSRKSLRDVVRWMEDLYTWGEHAYGVIDSPTSVRRTRARKASKAPAAEQGVAEYHKRDVPRPQATEPTPDSGEIPTSRESRDESQVDAGKLDKMVSYLTLGYGSYWSFPGTSTPSDASHTQPTNATALPPASRPRPLRRTSSTESTGHYLIGLKGDIEDELTSDAADNTSQHSDDDEPQDSTDGNNSRTVLRTVNVELESISGYDRPEGTIVRDFEHPASPLTQSQVVGSMLPGCYDSHDLNKAEKLRAVVYVNRPFIFVFLFRLRTDSLAWDALYRSLHYQLSPLRRSLIASTSYRPERPYAGLSPTASTSSSSSSHIHDLVWDPPSLTVHSTIPNIPDLYADPSSSSSSSSAAAQQQVWSRADAVSTHLHLLNIRSTTHSRHSDLERTQKSNRGWWIVWSRVLQQQQQQQQASSSPNPSTSLLSTIHESSPSSPSASLRGSRQEGHSEEADDDSTTTTPPKQSESSSSNPQAVSKEIFLIRRASDHIGFRILSDEASSGGGEGMGKLAQGIGVDTRRYIEELLSLL